MVTYMDVVESLSVRQLDSNLHAYAGWYTYSVGVHYYDSVMCSIRDGM